MRCKLSAMVTATPGFWMCVEHRGESHSRIIKSHATPIRRRDPLIWARQPAPFSWLDANGGWACEVASCWALFLWIIVSVDSLLIDSKATREPFSSTLFYLMWFYFPSVTSCSCPDPCADGSFLCFYPNGAQFCWPLMLNKVSVVFICAENGRVLISSLTSEHMMCSLRLHCVSSANCTYKNCTQEVLYNYVIHTS